MSKEAKTRTCKSCGIEVVKKAKVCPNCGSKLKMGLLKKIAIGFGILVVLGWMLPDGDTNEKTTPTTATAPEKTTEKTPEKTPEQIAKEKADAEAKAAQEEAAKKISDSDKALLKLSYAAFNEQQIKQFAEIEEKYKNLPNSEVTDISADFARLSTEKIAEEKKQAEAKAAAEKAAAYKEWVDSQFSAWDGSNIYLVDLLKDHLNDPKSFEHVETTYKDMGDYLIIKMTYRAKNAFGGLILQNVTAKADYKTNMISIISTNN